MKGKAIWKSWLTVLVALSMMLVMLPFTGLKTQAAEISMIKASCDDLYAPAVGTEVTLPTIVETGGSPVKVQAHGWYYDDVIVPEGSHFEEGVYALYASVTLNDPASDTFSAFPVLEVNGMSWDFANVWEEEGNKTAYFYCYFTVDPAPVVQFNDESFFVPESKVGEPIVPIDIKDGVIGGEAPYAFIKQSGPDWLIVTSEGIIQGTPTVKANSSFLEIKIIDNNGDEGLALIWVDGTRPDDRAVAYDVDVVTTPADLRAQVAPGNPIPTVTFNISTTGVKLDPSKTYWQKYNAGTDSWDTISSGTFEGGRYRYHAGVTIEDPSLVIFVEPRMWTEPQPDTLEQWNLESNTDSEATFYSDEYVIGEVVSDITINGVPVPVDGIGVTTSGTTLKENGIYISNMFWTDYDGNYVGIDETFDGTDPSREYMIFIALEAEDGYTFAEEASLNATVNGLTSAKVERITDNFVFVSCYIPFAEVSGCLYIVTAGSLNVRNSASINSDRIGGVKYAEMFYGIAESGNWVMFEYEGQIGWVNRDYVALTYTEDTAMAPVKYTVTAGALNVRSSFHVPTGSEPDNRIGSYTAGKEILVTGKVTAPDHEDWMVVDYNGEAGHKLGFVMAKYVDGEAPMVSPEYISAKMDIPSMDLKIFTGGIPSEFAASTKSALAIGDDVTLKDANFEKNADGSYTVNIFPADGKNFSELTKDNIELPSDANLVLKDLVKKDDGSIDLKMEPAVAYQVKFESNGGSPVEAQTVPSGNTAHYPAAPTKEGYTFDRWYTDEACTSKFDFSTPITQDTVLYARWMVNILGVKLHGYEIEHIGSGYHLKMDVREAIFEKDTAPLLVGASGLYQNKEITKPLNTKPVGGETYYFAVTLEDIYGDEGHPDVYYTDKMKTNNDATADEGEVEYVSLKRTLGGKYATVVFSYKPAEIVYTFEKGADASWEKGAAEVQYVVKRNLNDAKTFGLFDHIEVDGTTLAASDFTAVSGSLDATLKSSFLETLAAGAHDVKIFFEDGVAETKLTIKETADGSGSSGGGGANGGSNGGSPQTGDSSQLHLYLVLIAASLLVLLAVTLVVSVKRAGHGRRRM